MAALTAKKALEIKGESELWAFPVASGETIYGGTLAVIDDDGYLRNLSSTYAPQAKLVCLVADDTANASGAAATTAAGSISGSLEAASVVAGDKTVRNVYLDGYVKGTFASIAQSDVGVPVYATNNNDIDDAQNSGVFVGTLITYISATVGWYALNKKFNHSDTVFYKQAIVASSGGGGLFNVLNPTGATIVIERLALDLTTGTSSAGTIDVGVTTTLTTSDVLIDGVTSSLAGVFDNITNAGTNGGATVKCTSAQYITGTVSIAAGATLAGSVGIWYRYWE